MNQVGAISVDELMRLVAQRDGYAAMVAALTNSDQRERAVGYLRGVAAIGIATPPDDDEGLAFHADVMAVLAQLGLEPLTAEELSVQMQAAENLLAQRDAIVQ